MADGNTQKKKKPEHAVEAQYKWSLDSWYSSSLSKRVKTATHTHIYVVYVFVKQHKSRIAK